MRWKIHNDCDVATDSTILARNEHPDGLPARPHDRYETRILPTGLGRNSTRITMNERTQFLKKQALAHLRSNHLAEAKVLYRQLCQIDPRDADSWSLLSAVHGMLGEFEHAETCCRRVISMLPDAVGAYSNLGNALRFQGKLDEAERCYRKAIALMPAYAEAHNNLGNLLKQEERIQEAETCYHQAVTFAPNYTDAHNNLGIVQWDQGRSNDALKSYQRALELDPNHRDALYSLGHILFERGDLPAAEKIFERLIKVYPQDVRTWVALGSLHDMSRQPDRAIASFERAISLQPDYAEGHFRLGRVFQSMDLRDKARTSYERALALDPRMANAHYFLASIGNEAVPAEWRTEYVKKTFDDYAERFDATLVKDLRYQAPELLHRAVRRTLGEGRKEIEMLDLGCGTGLCGMPFRDIVKRLTGVDLSPKMIRKARERSIYDELILGDLLTPMQGRDARYDLIVAADVFIYVGDLSAIFAACKIALRPGGLFAFSTEHEADTPSYVLRNSGRYAHPTDYVRTQAHDVGLTEISIEQAIIRQEEGKPVVGQIFVFQQSTCVTLTDTA